LTNSQIYDEITLPVIGLRDGMFNELIPSESNRLTAEAWNSLLREFADEQDRETRRMPDEAANAHVCAPLQKLSGGPCQSLGGYFDYSNWDARERFMELDRAIAANRYAQRFEREPNLEMV
jgi:hypothetical protein